MFRTCYGRSQYILGWYSIRTGDVQVTPACTTFIHEVFCKEINKSSPITAANSALHLEVIVDVEKGAIRVDLWTGLGAGEEVFSLVRYAVEDAALLARNESVSWSELVANAPADVKAQLPDATAYAQQTELFQRDLTGFNELMGVLVDELHSSQRLYLN